MMPLSAVRFKRACPAASGRLQQRLQARCFPVANRQVVLGGADVYSLTFLNSDFKSPPALPCASLASPTTAAMPKNSWVTPS
jgi:hypothetical protein